MDSSNHTKMYIPPFELFSTVLSNTHEAVKVETHTISIKCNNKHQPLLHKLFSKLFATPPSDIAHIQFSLSRVILFIGHQAYQNLLHEKNKYFNKLATIPW